MENIVINNSVRFKKCPLCDSSSIFMIGLIKADNPMFFSSTEILLTKRPEYWMCKNCLSGFSQNIICEKDAAQLYAHNQLNKWEVSNFETEKVPGLIYEVNKYINEKTRVLDVGCNTGELLDYCKQFGAETVGVEYSELCSSICQKKGHKMYNSIGSIPLGEKFDIVFAFDLAEHLYDIRHFFSVVDRVLSDKGKILILTGNPGCLSAKLAKSKWWYVLPPVHIIFPSRNFFSILHNFRLINYLPFFNSRNYLKRYIFNKEVVYKVMVLLVKFCLFKYNGFPSLDPDHALVILEKQPEA